ncbi:MULTISPECIES: hypothetical protein [unclassified Mycolicibacterium]|uniref:hypothetical protein n=1 Tax=unclassified Mycolicibacterium TaxID=2636767 RepID=UPI0012DD84DE|nr:MULTISPECIES: hypothetical protein [unclassified Mycolicibacterium]MUL83380.1 hypothetical protein [Mycolicibacterium sp. CBMA 329]MUL90371.1 hypothetical protein [Mycolicibacterium sp. CBMA 331]MUM00345.1 hypothetical protein [Mycolicibacterium sp. CBMA 334]MUM27632.1 hypothetical protein [Mycolicibacterium sp. CBMA 295]MUM41315.1 hypothetical protein [Mycolicibacterium sp. CBMA 247]
MRTAVVRVGVDPAGELGAERLSDGMATLRELLGERGAEVLDNQLAGLPAHRREVEVLIAGDHAPELQAIAMELCAKAFGTSPAAGVVTFVSRGTDEDVRGVLAGFGLSGDISRSVDDEGWDVVTVTLDKADLTRIPESRVHTALEASLNCEVHILTV